jgi:hypothetical protein
MDISGASQVPEMPPGTEYRCALCPHPADLINPEARFPPPTDPQNSPLTHFPCGHSFHTQCVFGRFARLDHRIYDYCSCFVCDESILSQDQRDFLMEDATHNRNQRRGSIGPDVAKLWQENDTFREQYRELAKESREVSKLEKLYKSEIDRLKTEFNQNIHLAVETIRSEKERFLRRVSTECPNRTKFIRAQARFGTKLNRLMGTYDLYAFQLERMRRVRGVPIPRIRLHRRYYRWRLRPQNIFRVRI